MRENGASSAPGLLATYTYDALGRQGALTRGNGTMTTFTYDSASRLTGLDQALGSAAYNQVLGFTYNPASQIVQRTASNDNYRWSAPTLSRSYARNGLNQYDSVSGVAFDYDDRGNLTSDGSRTFTYDLENHLLSVAGSAAMSLTYDALGRLATTNVSGASTCFIYDGDRLSLESDCTGVRLRRYVHGPGVDEPLVWYEGADLADRRYLIADHQGSIIAANGSSMTRYAYGPYGEPDVWSGARFRYTGQAMLPDVRLYHYKARVYDPGLGPFLQTDPIGYKDDVNLYAYVRNDPLNRSDPTGSEGFCGGTCYPDDLRELATPNAQRAIVVGLLAVPVLFVAATNAAGAWVTTAMANAGVPTAVATATGSATSSGLLAATTQAAGDELSGRGATMERTAIAGVAGATGGFVTGARRRLST